MGWIAREFYCLNLAHEMPVVITVSVIIAKNSAMIYETKLWVDIGQTVPRYLPILKPDLLFETRALPLPFQAADLDQCGLGRANFLAHGYILSQIGYLTSFLVLPCFLVLHSKIPLCYYSSTVFRKPNPSSGVPIYVQLKEQIRHAIETGALSPGDQLPGIRSLAETLIINPNTVIKVYRDLEQEGILEIRHGLGAFIASRRRRRYRTDELRDAQRQVREFLETLKQQGLDEGEIRRLFEAELALEFQRR